MPFLKLRFFLLLAWLILFVYHPIFSNPAFGKYFFYKSEKIKFDSGINWEYLSNFKSIKLFPQIDSKDSLVFQNEVNIRSINALYGASLFCIVNFNSFFGYGGLNKDNEYSLNNFIDINFYKSLVSDKSGFGFSNDWVTIQILKGKEDWGAGNNIDLVLSQNSSNYDYLNLSSDYGNLRVNYIHGMLEKRSNNVNRYINARGFEWTNKKNFIIGFSETIIYSGENRSLDIGYFNPIASHVEVELNDRLNIKGSGSANAIWQLHIDYLILSKLRFSLNYLLDEFVFDRDLEVGKEHGKAFSVKNSLLILDKNHHKLNFSGSVIYIGTPTLRHSIGENNFVNDGKPLGPSWGSDGVETNLKISYINFNQLICDFSFGSIKKGEESINFRPYDPYPDYQKGKFPSGKIVKTKYLKMEILWSLSPSYYFSFSSSIYGPFNKASFDNSLNISKVFN